MTTRRGAVGMSDALTAARAMQLTTPAELRMLTELLGLAQDQPAPNREPRKQIVERPGLAEASVAATVDLGTDGVVTGEPELRTLAEPLPPEPVAPIAYVVAEPLSPAPGAWRVPHRSIRPPHQLRAALTMLIRRPRPSIRLDVEAAVDLIAERQPIDRLPRLIEQTVDGGVTIIADIGPDMLPLLDDVNQFVEIARHVAGEPTTEVTWVADAVEPATVLTDRPVLVISSLGTTRAPAAEPGAELRWRTAVQELVAAEADVSVLVPHRRMRSSVPAEVRFTAWDDLGEVSRGHR